MSIAQEIAGNLPYLRRYGRALTGSQRSGDAYVTTLLEALVADEAVLDPDLPSKVALYKLFTGLWKSVPLNVEPRNGGALVEQRLEALTPESRQAFLLVAMERFDEGQVAAILDTKEATVRELIARANRKSRLKSRPTF